jgi:virginiamycin B lyase
MKAAIRFFLAGVWTVALSTSLAAAVATAHVQQFSNARNLPNVYPTGIIVGPDNNLWFVETGAIGRVSPAGAIVSFALPHHASDHPVNLTVGPDNALWFALPDSIGRITTNGTIRIFPDPTPNNIHTAIINGPKKRLWFIDKNPLTQMLGSMGLDGTMAPVSVDKAIDPSYIIAGHDNTVWFVEALNKPAFPTDPIIGRITATGHVSLFPIHVKGCGMGICTPLDLSQTKDGSIWFPVFGQAIGRLSTRGQLSFFPLIPPRRQPTDRCQQGIPVRITHDARGRIWFGEMTYPCIGMLTPKGATTYLVTNRIDNIGGLAADMRGNIWFTLTCVNSVGRLTQGGHATVYHIPHTAADAGEACPETL